MVAHHDCQLEKTRNPWASCFWARHVCEGSSRLGKLKWEDLMLRQVAPLNGWAPETIQK